MNFLKLQHSLTKLGTGEEAWSEKVNLMKSMTGSTQIPFWDWDHNSPPFFYQRLVGWRCDSRIEPTYVSQHVKSQYSHEWGFMCSYFTNQRIALGGSFFLGERKYVVVYMYDNAHVSELIAVPTN